MSLLLVSETLAEKFFIIRLPDDWDSTKKTQCWLQSQCDPNGNDHKTEISG